MATKTTQQLFNFAMTHLRTQGMESNTHDVEWQGPKGQSCQCVFGCIGKAIKAIYSANHPYNSPKWVSTWLGRKVTTASRELHLLSQMECIFEGRNWDRELRQWGWTSLDLAIRDKEKRFERLAQKFNLKYNPPVKIYQFDDYIGRWNDEALTEPGKVLSFEGKKKCS